MSTLGLGLHSALGPLGIPSLRPASNQYTDTVTEALALAQTDTITRLTFSTATDAIGLSPLMTVVLAIPALAAETLVMADALTILRGVLVGESIEVTDAQLVSQVMQLTLAETVALVEQLQPGIPAAIAETVALALTQQVQQAVSVIEALELTPLITPTAIYGRTVAEALALVTSLGNFFGASVSETTAFVGTMAGIKSTSAILAETVTLAGTVNPALVLRVTAAESLELDDATLLRSIYSGAVDEAFELAAAFISNGNITTWAMNTRTGAVSEYSNYEFNSFAQLGNKYLGASSSGLYELVGDDDAGTDIIATIKSGFAQFAGTRFTMFKGIYLGVRGEGDYVLKLVTGEGQTTTYSVAARDMRSTRVHTGKGLRARYFAFELISDGQDFDLDTIEFVPLVAQRRV